jgi:hypothetical protein
MRMQAYRMVLSSWAGDTRTLARQVAEFEHSLGLLRNGDPERPLVVPWDDVVRQRYAKVDQDGSANVGDITQGGSGSGYIQLGQTGDSNFARMQQGGTGQNVAYLTQSGTSNWA